MNGFRFMLFNFGFFFFFCAMQTEYSSEVEAGKQDVWHSMAKRGKTSQEKDEGIGRGGEKVG